MKYNSIRKNSNALDKVNNDEMNKYSFFNNKKNKSFNLKKKSKEKNPTIE